VDCKSPIPSYRMQGRLGGAQRRPHGTHLARCGCPLKRRFAAFPTGCPSGSGGWAIKALWQAIGMWCSGPSVGRHSAV
jgi:hypothetical protein